MLSKNKIGFIGGGNMAEALLKGMLSSAGPLDVAVSDLNTNRLEMFRTQYGVEAITKDSKKVVEYADVIIFAVKPQVIPEILDEIKDLVADKLIVSIAAGVLTASIESHLNEGARVVRVMPNTPALVGMGASGICKGSNATPEDIELVQTMMETIGVCVVVGEDRMDAITGLSGSGPAYVYTFIDALADAGVNMGLTRVNATTLAAQTVMGAAKMVLETGIHPCQLKDNVTTPAGTTICALHELDRGAFRSTVMNAVESATKKAAKLGKLNK
ncbi:pyrroline-5-carboxylate reductase [Denitrovibrio acetiphilus DSM 12809]|uniref:Pyrroline-5-carboxylate reductase n=2 Tax=Denitrovibrio TaxID=117999 RepID=D4H8D7_DENA2|nr:pyrroline-5-carboxylate reductase [Denitrovibrio acetiphilus DSM 12809]